MKPQLKVVPEVHKGKLDDLTKAEIIGRDCSEAIVRTPPVFEVNTIDFKSKGFLRICLDKLSKV